jgi:hypothetical protein
MLKSEQDETALLSSVKEIDKLVVSKALLIVVGSFFIIGVLIGLLIFYLFLNGC